MLESVIAGIMSYAATNVDDLFLNTVFFAQAETRQEIRRIAAGKFGGIAVLVLLSLLGAAGVRLLETGVAGLLGFVPLFLGIREWIRYRRSAGKEPSAEPPRGISAGQILFLTVANGADNLGVYIPLFAGSTPGQITVMVLLFAAMTGLWCVLGRNLSRLPVLRSLLLRGRHILVPAVLILLGAAILLRGFFG